MKTTISQLAIFLIMALSVAGTAQGQNSFTEDFTTTNHQGDPAQITARWDTQAGQLHHPAFVSTLIGANDPGGDARAVVIDGDLAYVAAGFSGLQVFDISNPEAPVLLDTYNTSGYAYAVAFKERFIFVADWEDGVQVIDAFFPSNLVLAATYNSPGSVLDLDISGNHLFLGDGTDGLTILDITDPYAPTFLGSYDTSGNAARGLDAVGDHVYLTDGNAGLKILNISDPTQPTLVGTFDTPGYAYDVVVSGGHAYVSDEGNGLVVVNISNNEAPYEESTLSIPEILRGLTVRGKSIFLVSNTSGMLVIDISNPALPVLQETFDTSGHALDVAISGNLAYVADLGAGLKVIEIADADVFSLAGSLNTPATDRDVWVEGNLAYLATSTGMQVVDITEGWNPQLLGNTALSGYDVQVVGHLAYVAEGNNGLVVYDVSDPVSAVNLGSFSSEYITECKIEGALAYCTGGSTMHILDVSNPGSISEIGGIAFPGNSITDLAIHGRFALLTNGNQGLRIVNIAEPTYPVLILTYATQYTAHNVEINGDYAYVGCYSNLEIVDISDPLSPVQAAIATRPGRTFREVVVKGNSAFAITDSTFIRYDITDPGSPVFDGDEFHIPGHGFTGLHVAGDYAYLVTTRYGNSNTTGLEVVQVSQRSVPADRRGVIAYSSSLSQGNDSIVRSRALWDGAMNGDFYVGTDLGILSIVENAEWRMTAPFSEMFWLANLVWEPNAARPFLNQVTVEWLTDFAPIKTLVDAPGDQGGWARLNLDRSGYDFAENSLHPVTGYQIYRRVDDPALKNITRDDSEQPDFQIPEAGGLQRWTFQGRSFVQAGNKAPGDKAGTFPAGTWEAVSWVGATQSDDYTVAVPTVADSTASGDHWSHFLVTTHTTTPSDWYVSSVSSVQSVDNITPEMPQNFVAGYSGNQAQLDWDDAPEDDFDFHRVYRDLNYNFVPSAGNLIAETAGSAWTDVINGPAGYHYKVTTLDYAGNESEAASLNLTTDIPQGGQVLSMEILGAAPNPFNPATTIRYSTPQSGSVHLAIYDVAGRQIKELVSGHQEAGQHSATWRGLDASGRVMAAGVYVCLLRAHGKNDSQMLVLVK